MESSWPESAYKDPTSESYWLRITLWVDSARGGTHAKIDRELWFDERSGLARGPSEVEWEAARHAHRECNRNFDDRLMEAWHAHRPSGPRDGECIPGEVDRISRARKAAK